jgi:H+/Cl- antiporter ClcA
VKKKSSTPLLDPLKRVVRTFLAYGDHLQSMAFWLSAFLAAFVSVTYAWLFKMAETAYHQVVAAHPQAVWFWTPLCLLASWALVVFLAPEAAGSGIPQVLAANDLNYKRD